MAPKDPRRTRRFREARARLLAQDGNVCGICYKIVDKELRPPAMGAPQADHIIPISAPWYGDPYDMANLQLAHSWCNRQKSNKYAGQGTLNSNKPQVERIDLNRMKEQDWSD